MPELTPGTVVPGATVTAVHELLPADQVVAGTPTTATVELGGFAGVELGVWEMTPGTATDVEADEVFVVLSGRARVVFTDRDLAPIEIGPGDIVRLEHGMRTEWTVTETLRKVYLA
ncbi:cupin domain-containing protein [Microbacterium sp. GXF7504]